jgi:hypothetical protein
MNSKPGGALFQIRNVIVVTLTLGGGLSPVLR